MTCSQCDIERKVAGQASRIGQPCDICGGRGYDYLGRSCRHCSSLPAESDDE